MKLHLPKLLCAAVMVAMGLAQADAVEVVQESTSTGHTYTDVGKASKNNDADANFAIINTDDGIFKVKDGDIVGTFIGDAENLEDKTLLTTHNYATGSKGDDISAQNISNSLQVGGGESRLTGLIDLSKLDNLLVEGSGQIVLMGKQGSNFYAGLQANEVTVKGNDSSVNIDVAMARFAKLTIVSGNVKLRTNTGAPQGNSTTQDATSYKQAQVTKLIDVQGGTLVMGGKCTTGKDTEHYICAVAGEIRQSGGDIKIQGKTYAGSGLSINQTGGSMSIAEGYKLRIGGGLSAGKLSITQGGGAGTELNIGKIIPTNPSSKLNSQVQSDITVVQNGAGTINFKDGVLFKSKSGSTINQSGGGTINLSGDFTSADFTVTQTKGTINQKGTMDLVGTNDVGGTLVNSGTLTIADVNVIGTLVNDGTMTISGKATISGKFVNNTNSLTATTLNLVEGGVFENNGTWAMSSGNLNAGTIAGTGTYVSQSNLTLKEGTLQLTLADISDSSPSTFGGTLLDVNSYTLDVASDVTIALAMSGEVETLFRTMLANQADTPVEFTMLVAEDVSNWQNLDTAALAAQTEHSAYISGVSYSARDGKVYVSGKLIPEPTTATLSLMALAALAARRRRK